MVKRLLVLFYAAFESCHILCVPHCCTANLASYPYLRHAYHTEPGCLSMSSYSSISCRCPSSSTRRHHQIPEHRILLLCQLRLLLFC